LLKKNSTFAALIKEVFKKYFKNSVKQIMPTISQLV